MLTGALETLVSTLVSVAVLGVAIWVLRAIAVRSRR